VVFLHIAAELVKAIKVLRLVNTVTSNVIARAARNEAAEAIHHNTSWIASLRSQ